MAISINKIHDFINFLRNQGQVQYFEPEKIDEAVNAAIIDKFEEEIAEFKKTGTLSDVLQSFKKSQELALTNGEVALPNDFVYSLSFSSILNSVEYEGELRDELTWNSRDMSDLTPDKETPDDPLHWYQKRDSITLVSGEGDLPTDFIKELAFSVIIDGVKFRGAIRSADEWDRKSMEDIIKHQDTDNPEDPFHWFKKKANITITSGEGDLPNDFVKEISFASVVSGKEFEGEIRELKDFFSKSVKDLIPDPENPEKPLHWYYHKTNLTLDANGEAELPEDFVKETGIASVISNKEYQGEFREATDVHRANAEDLKIDMENEEDPMHYYKKDVSLSLTNNKATLPVDFIQKRAGSVLLNNKEFKAFIVNDEKWTSRSTIDLVPDPENPNDPLHWYRKSSDLSITNKKVTLPEDTIKIEEVSVEVDGVHREAKEVPRSKWNSRITSVTIPPEEEHPIYKVEDNEVVVEPEITSGNLRLDYLQYPVVERALLRISDSSIEAYPNGITDIRLYYNAFPVEKHPVGIIADNTVCCVPKSLDEVRLYYYRFPVDRRPIGTFYDGNAKVEPVDLQEINLYYYAFPVPKMPIMRIENSKIVCDPLTNETIEFRYLKFPVEERPIGLISENNISVEPSTLSNIKLYYIKLPNEVNYGYTISGDGRSFIHDPGSSIDSDMPDNTFPAITTKALEYLGVAMDDQMLLQFQQFNKKGKLDD